MDLKDLLKKYQALLIENDRLREEIKNLNAQLGPDELQDSLTNNLLSFGCAEESMMRLESPNVAFELIKSAD